MLRANPAADNQDEPDAIPPRRDFAAPAGVAFDRYEGRA
jgi:hypothetical protein